MRLGKTSESDKSLSPEGLLLCTDKQWMTILYNIQLKTYNFSKKIMILLNGNEWVCIQSFIYNQLKNINVQELKWIHNILNNLVIFIRHGVQFDGNNKEWINKNFPFKLLYIIHDAMHCHSI